MARSPSGGSGRGPRDRDRGRDRGDEENELKDKLVTINRVAVASPIARGTAGTAG